MEKHKDVTVDAMTTLVTSLLSTSGQVAAQDSDVLEVDSETRNVQQDVNPQDKKLAEKTEVLLGTMTDTLLKKMGGKKQDLKIETPSLSIALKKAPLTQMQASRFDLKGSEVSLPKRMISSRGSNAVALKVSKMKVNPYKYGNGGQRTNTPVIQMAMQDPGSGGQTAVYMDEDDQLKLEIQTDYENHGNGNQGNGKRQSTSTKKLGIGDGNTTTLLTYTIVSEHAAFILRLDLIRASKYVIYGTLDVNKIDFVFRINISGSTFTLEKNWKVEVTLTGSSLQVFIPSKEIIFSSLERKLFVVVKKYEVTLLSTKRNRRSLRKSRAVTPPGGQVTAMTYEARYWKDGEWKTDDGLEITPNSTVENVVFKSNFFGTFCAGLFIPPNKIDFDAIIANFAERLNKTPHVLVTVIILLIVYAFCAVWARRADNRDRLMWEYRPIPGNSPDHENEYFVKVYTGLARGAGTTANVFIILSGIKADTGSRILTDGERKNFQRGNLNNFYITTREHLGELKNLCIWHDCYGDSSSWNLEKVVVYDPKDDCRYVFNCQQWLALDKADGQTCRRLSVYSLENLKTFNTLLSAHANNNLYEDHIWLSVTRRPNHSTFTRVQRLTCCFAILSLAMCTSAMWFETVDATQKGIELGVITITMQQITVGFMSSLVVVPPSVAMIELFRRRKRRMASKSCHVITLKIDKSFRFPWWTVFIAYFLAFASAFLGAFFSLFYSLEWGPEKTSSWLISLCLSFFQSVIVIQPIKVILVAVIFACLMKLPSDEEYEIRYERYTHDFILKGSVNAIKVGKPRSVKAADKNESENSILIEQKREELHLDKKLTGYFKTVLRNMLCLLLLVLICDNNRSKSTFRLNKALKNLLVTPPKGSKFPDIMYWVRDTIIPGTYPRHSYNGEELPNYEKAFLPDVYAYRMGPARLRQLRVKAKHGCPQTILPSGVKGCALSYNYENEDRLNYSIGWESNQAPFAKECSWKPSQDFAKSFSGIYTYGSGGYSVELGRSRSSALNVVKRLVNFEWIDRRTRVLFVELLLYSANVNLFSNVKLVVEFPVSSGFFFSGHVFSFKPYPYVSSFDFLVFLAQIVWVIINVYFMVKCGIGIYKQKCAYLKDIWNCLQLFEVVLAMAAIGTFLARTFLIIQVVEKIMNNKGKFVSVDLLTDLDNGLTLLLAIALLTATIRLMKPLSFLETFAILKGTLRVSLHIVFSYSLIFAIISLAYGTLLFILFSSYLEAFHTLPYTMYKEFGMVLGIIKYKTVIVKDNWEAKTIIGSFYILNLIILMNMFVTVISDTISSVKHGKRIPGYDPKLRNHLMKKLHTLSAYVLTTLTRDDSSKPSRHEDDQVTVNEDMDAAVRLAIALEERFNKYYKSIIYETTIMNLQYIGAKREQLQLKREVRETQREVAKMAGQLNQLQRVVKSLVANQRQQSPWSNAHTCDCSDVLWDVHWFHFPDGRLAFVIQSISGSLDSNLIEFAEIKDILLPTDIIGTAVTILSWKNIFAEDDLFVGMPVESQGEGVSYMYYISFDLGVTWKGYPAELTTLKDTQNQEFRVAQVRLASLPTCFMLTGRTIHERESSLEIIDKTMGLVQSVRLVETVDENTRCSPMVKLHVDSSLEQKLKVNVDLLGNPEKSGDVSCTDYVVMVRHGSSERWREQHGTYVTSQDDGSVNFVLNVSHKWDCIEFFIKTRPSIWLNLWNSRTEEVLDDPYLATLAVKLDRDWVQLAEELKVPSGTLQRLTQRRVKAEHERAYLMLQSLCASMARAKRDKIKTLTDALMKINRVDLAIETLHYGEERQCVIQQYIEELKLIKAFAVALRSNDIVDNLPDLASLLGIPEDQQEMSVDLSSDKGALPRSEEEKCMAIFLAWKDRTPNCRVALLQERLLAVPGWKAVADKIGCIE